MHVTAGPMPEPEIEQRKPTETPAEPREPPRPTGTYIKVKALIAGSHTLEALDACLDDARTLANGERRHAQWLYAQARKRIHESTPREPGSDG